MRGAVMTTLEVPAAYRPGYARACQVNPELARLYIKHTTVGDPLADALMQALSGLSPQEENRLIMAGMHNDKRVLAQAPAPLVDFFEELKQPPPWFDPQRFDAGCRTFHTHSDLFMPAFFLVTVLNATSLIAKSFYATGRVMSGFGARRIRQNVRHFVEIMLPGALEDQGDGWRLSVRIRLVHARLRKLIKEGGGGK